MDYTVSDKTRANRRIVENRMKSGGYIGYICSRIKAFLGTTQTGKNKTIIAKNVADGKLQLSHGSF